MKGYICDICEKFVDNPFKVHMREFVMAIDFGDGTDSPLKIRKKVHMCGDCYTKFVNYIKYKSLKEKIDEQTEKSMPKDNLSPKCIRCEGCGSICDDDCFAQARGMCDGCTADCPKKGESE